MRRSILAVIASVGAATVAFSACSLGLDESKLDLADGGANDGVAPDAPAKSDGAVNPTQCNQDQDCKPANACLVGKCNVALHQCSYDICPAPKACQASVCDTNSKTCSVPTQYGFHAGSFHLTTGTIGCGGGAQGAHRCFAASYPFVFIGTTNGVVARSVVDPTDSSPDVIPIGGVPFVPAFVVASGSRIYFVGFVGGSGPDYKVPIAWLDAPTDPTVKSMTATSVFDSVQVSQIDGVWPDTKGGVYLARGDGAKSYPVARITAPLKDLEAVQFFPLAGIPQNHGPIAASGTRVVTATAFGQYQTAFSLETGAGTGSAQNAGAQETTATFGAVAGNFFFAQGPDGSLVASGTAVSLPDGGQPTSSGVRVAWLVADEKATTFDATAHVDIEPYTNAGCCGGDFAGPVAWIDSKRALVLSAPASNLAQTAVQIVTREGAPSVVANRKFVLPFHPSELGAAASSSYGYVMTPDQVSGLNVHVFAAGCDN